MQLLANLKCLYGSDVEVLTLCVPHDMYQAVAMSFNPFTGTWAKFLHSEPVCTSRDAIDALLKHSEKELAKRLCASRNTIPFQGIMEQTLTLRRGGQRRDSSSADSMRSDPIHICEAEHPVDVPASGEPLVDEAPVKETIIEDINEHKHPPPPPPEEEPAEDDWGSWRLVNTNKNGGKKADPEFPEVEPTVEEPAPPRVESIVEEPAPLEDEWFLYKKKDKKKKSKSDIVVEEPIEEPAADIVPDNDTMEQALFTQGWTEISTPVRCNNVNCKCLGSGTCRTKLFNHYLVRSADLIETPKLHTDTFFPINISVTDAEDVNIEEVTASQATLGSAFKYFSNCILDSPDESFVAVVMRDYKSICFNVDCYLVAVEEPSSIPDALLISDTLTDNEWALSIDARIISLFLESLSLTGTTPIVPPLMPTRMTEKGSTLGFGSIDIVSGSFEVPEDGIINVSGTAFLDRLSKAVLHLERPVVTAVRTATVTLSIRLRPKSMYGGRDPSTKLISYIVHNIKYN